ncbi:hypothetical protein C0991_012054 [Blastosporella zonata]|nr:hypothetical protein C0991_012054 [Blastosporella zonata]
MASSELSNALNPYANQHRARTTYPVPYDHPEPPQPLPYVPHRSELELAISEPPPPPPPTVVFAPRQPTSASINAVQELLRLVASTKESQEIERNRRLEWEREQEVKYAHRQAEMERKLHELTQEVITLRSTNISNPTPPSSGMLTPQHMLPPPLGIPHPSQPVSPISPVSQPSSYPYPTFVQGSSNQPFPGHQQNYDIGYHPSPEPIIMETPAASVTPSPSPHLTYVQPNQLHQSLSVPPMHGMKRPSSVSSGDESSSSSSSSSSTRRVKRVNHHDTRCLTIHHAMRSHILRSMRLENDKELPNSHTEGVILSADDAVRFVWDKTTKQSVHNNRMKARILADIKANRKKYKHVPDKDFGKKNLESAFEACFVTLRQKYKVQQNPDDAQKLKQREDNKSRRARHVSRRKLKLNSRAEARMRVDALQHVIFDGALQLECMSSEDSDDDRSSGMLYTRGHQWRSYRLKRFYSILDEEEHMDKVLMPKRGSGKKERCVGPPKDFALPPERVATWMISRRWITASQFQYPDLASWLAKRIEDPPGFEWENFDVLGEESDADEDRRRVQDFLQLHDQVQVQIILSVPNTTFNNNPQTSVDLLDSLESFLSTFQKDLSAVSGQISELQDRSKDIENRLKSRRKIEKPLSSLISDITIPPPLATIILDSPVGEPWIEAIDDFERRLVTTKSRSRVKAARDLGEVAEGLRIVAATKLRGFFLALFQPIRSNVTTNMQVIQTSVLLKYSSLFAFLQRQAPNVAHEVQREYVAAARVYYETGFRRYSRSLTWIRARTIEKFETIIASEREKDLHFDLERLAFSKIAGPGVTLAYMADDKNHVSAHFLRLPYTELGSKKEPIEALLRSLLLVFMDNATAEYTFLKTFFSVEASLPTEESVASMLSPPSLHSPDRATFADRRSMSGSDYGGQRAVSASILNALTTAETTRKEEQAGTDALWKQIMDPSFLKSTLDPIPPAIPLLTMIRLMEDVVLEVQKRSCPPVEFYVFGLRLQMWPVFQKVMAENTDALKKLAEGGSSGYFSRAIATTDVGVSNICKRYTVLFNSFIQLTEQEDETMIFSNLLRLRQELTKLILRHTNSITDVVAKATALSSIYESLLQGLSKGTHLSAHPKSQQEIAHWANLEEEARRKIISAGRQRQR